MPAQARTVRIRHNPSPNTRGVTSGAAVARTQRALETLGLLQSGQSWSAAELAERFRCSTRTICRDMQLLRDCGIPIDAPKGARGFKLAHDFFWKPVQPTLDEMIALVVGTRLAGESLPQDLAQRMELAVAKIVGGIEPAVRERLGELAMRIDAPHQISRPVVSTQVSLPRLLEQIVGRTPVRVWRQEPGAGSASPVVLIVEQLHVAQGVWQLVGMPDGSPKRISVPLAHIAKIEPLTAQEPAESTSAGIMGESSTLTPSETE